MRTLPICLLAFLFFTNLGCKKSETIELQKKIVDPSLLKGTVFLYDEGWNSADQSGMNVAVENSNPLISTNTNSQGMFSLRVDTSIKSFTLVYSKSFYGTFKEYYVRENGILYQIQQGYYSSLQKKVPIKDSFLVSNPNLGRKSTTIVNSLRTAMIDGKLKIICNISFDGTIISSNGRFI